ncbi:accessory Sec system glycosyltransferase GtfA [Streptococcus pantholopis]|uniref:UDP-N-acetylglucosamine--peptide N-acetylglucosaminyltransferase GtfA subunit n=1 Tax=Streptococcus pantholopis TaxID=1811193 RepID=A0A172QAB9_9STRE|nr:accessory Sec system glycosyltransferase GtfA [Streptococcus pantholopis]AND80391.1 accessory Sec system glycosyltransferase GtfA [Streptococcus pantholopis]
MTVYSINFGLTWANSGVEYAQAYRNQLLTQLNVDHQFIFLDFIWRHNIADLAANLGFKSDEVIWLYTFFTDQKLAPTTFTLADLQKLFHGRLSQKLSNGNFVRFFYKEEDVFLTAYLKEEGSDIVHRVEYVSQGKLIRKDFFSYTRMFTEYYAPKDNKACLYQRRFFNEDGTLAYDELIDGDESIFRLADQICYSKEEFIAYFIRSLALSSEDMVILDRSLGIGSAVLPYVKPAKLAVAVHAEHFVKEASKDAAVLWNNHYEYPFSHAGEVDVFLLATEKQKSVLAEQFQQFTPYRPRLVSLPVGSISRLKSPKEPRKPFSLVTASRLVAEKQLEILIEATVQARQTLPDLSLDIYGQGSEESKLLQHIRENQAEDFIRLCGHQNLDELYQNYQVYVTASRSEGFGLSLMEALGSGLALIGFDVPYGNQTFIEEGKNGYLLSISDFNDGLLSQAFSQRIIDIFQSGSLESMSEASYGKAEDFLTERVAHKWLELLEEVTGK